MKSQLSHRISAVMAPTTGSRTRGYSCIWVSQPFPVSYRRIADTVKSYNQRVSQLAQEGDLAWLACRSPAWLEVSEAWWHQRAVEVP